MKIPGIHRALVFPVFSLLLLSCSPPQQQRIGKLAPPGCDWSGHYRSGSCKDKVLEVRRNRSGAVIRFASAPACTAFTLEWPATDGTGDTLVKLYQIRRTSSAVQVDTPGDARDEWGTPKLVMCTSFPAAPERYTNRSETHTHDNTPQTQGSGR